MNSTSCQMSVSLSENGTVFYHECDSSECVDGGGKATNLAFLNTIPVANVPQWGFVSCSVFKKIVLQETPAVADDLAVLSDAFTKHQKEADTRMVFNLAKRIRDTIRSHVFGSELVAPLRELYMKISDNGASPVAVRSSATIEDTAETSCAGLYDSRINQRTFDDFLEAIKDVWASAFSDRAMQYEMDNGLDPRKPLMGVVVQKMILPKSSGTAFTMDVSTGYQGINVVSNFGVEGVVGGEASDSHLFTKEGVLIKRTLARKTTANQPSTDKSGTEEVPVAVADATRESLSVSDAKRVACALKEIAECYSKQCQNAIDAEFCVTSDEKIHFLQIRPLTDISAKTVHDIHPTVSLSDLATLANGKYSVGGVSSGRIKVVKNFSQLESGELTVEPDDIIVAHQTRNQWSQFFTNFAGIVTMEGNPTAHPMLIARERGVPCVIGVGDAVNQLLPYDGQRVTIDGFRKKVYLGDVKLAEIPLGKVSEMFQVVQPDVLPDINEVIEEGIKKGTMFRDEAGDAWFVKPNSVLSGALLDLQLASFATRSVLLNRTGAEPAISIVGKQCVIESKVYEKVVGSLQDQVSVLNRLTLEQFERYVRQEEETALQYLKTCENFQLTISDWRSFCESFRDLSAYMWLSFITLASQSGRAYEMAYRLGIPKFYLSDCEANIQAATFEEDVAFRDDLYRLQQDVLKYFTKQQISELGVDGLRRSHPELYERLVGLERQYKFTSSQDWKVRVDLARVLKRVLDMQPYAGAANKGFTTTANEYFGDHEELLRWTLLETKSKILQNNLHHQRIRGQMLVRDKLLKLGEVIQSRRSGNEMLFEALNDKGEKVLKRFSTASDTLDATVEQIEKFISEFACA